MSNVMPMHRPRPPVHPEWCDCDDCGPPCPPEWSQDAIRCWQEMKRFQQMVREIVRQELACMDTGLVGVIDGSDAKPGMVGEFISSTSTSPYTTTPTATPVSAMVVPAGDWNIWGKINTSAPVTNATIKLSPLPTGISNDMFGDVTTPGLNFGMLYQARGSFKVPTLLPFSLTVTAAAAGTATLYLEGRRVR